MLPFGKKVKVMNFFVLKYTKTLKGGELKKLRNASGIPAEVRKYLQRGGLPYIKVLTLSENWSIEFICATTMYEFIDSRCQFTDGDVLTEEAVSSLHNLFALMYSDTAILGDTEYYEAKGRALNELIGRMQVKKETDESKAADDAILEEVKANEEARETLAVMGRAMGVLIPAGEPQDTGLSQEKLDPNGTGLSQDGGEDAEEGVKE